MATRLGIYSFAAGTAASFLIVALFYVFALQKVAQSTLYSYTDVYAGAVYVFILSMIVMASIVPGIIEKKLLKR